MPTKPSHHHARQSTGLHRTWHQHLWRDEIFFVYTGDYFESIIEGINQAKESVVLATYIFDYDEVGKQVIEALGKARRRGISVRVLLDGFGSMESMDEVVEAMIEQDIEIKIYHPLPWKTDNDLYAQHGHRSLRRGSWLGNFVFSLLKINQRHHAKICIVDADYLWSGSANITTDHLATSEGGGGWHDYGARVSGEAVARLVQMFDDFWDYRRPHLGHGLFKHYWNNISPSARQHKNRLLTEKIAAAKKTVWIINPYFSPTRSILRALRRAGMRGVDVRIIVPNKSDIGFFPFLTSLYYEELIKASVRIFEFLPAILHAKLLIVDDFRLIGSTNLNHRSLLHDIEFDIVLESEQSLKSSRDNFLKDQQQCREICSQDLTLLGRRRLLGWLPWLMRYWL